MATPQTLVVLDGRVNGVQTPEGVESAYQRLAEVGMTDKVNSFGMTIAPFYLPDYQLPPPEQRNAKTVKFFVHRPTPTANSTAMKRDLTFYLEKAVELGLLPKGSYNEPFLLRPDRETGQSSSGAFITFDLEKVSLEMVATLRMMFCGSWWSPEVYTTGNKQGQRGRNQPEPKGYHLRCVWARSYNKSSAPRAAVTAAAAAPGPDEEGFFRTQSKKPQGGKRVLRSEGTADELEAVMQLPTKKLKKTIPQNPLKKLSKESFFNF